MARSYRGAGTIRWGAQDGKDGVNYLIMGWWSASVHYKLTDAGIPVVKVEDDSHDGFSVYKLTALQSTLGTFIASEWEKVKSADFVYMQDAYIERLQAVLITAERIEALDIVHPSGLYSLIGGKLKVQDAEISGTINATSGNIEKLTISPGGYIELPPTFATRKGRLDNNGLQLVYDGSNSQQIEWYTGLGSYSGRIAPNSIGHLDISSTFGVSIQSQTINIGTEAYAGNINIGGGSAEIDFKNSVINNIQDIINIGFTTMRSLSLQISANSSMIIRHDVALTIITSIGSNSNITSIYMNNNNLLREGALKWILNRTTGTIPIATNGNIRINSADRADIQPHSLTPFIYSNGYWYKHSDWK